ncbi:MAG: hypothetical protein WC284_10185 [Candidimonas sp.]
MDTGSDITVYPWNADENGEVVGYMSLVDFITELGDHPGGVRIYRSESECRYYHPDVNETGIVQVKVKYSSLISGNHDPEQLMINLRQYRRSWTKRDIN